MHTSMCARSVRRRSAPKQTDFTLVGRSTGWCGAPERFRFHPCVPGQSGGAVRLNKLTSPLSVVQPAGAVRQKDSGFIFF
ncbi:hypothetical protein [Paraglaciecola agarilytica]|uniref:hypothetical protein n=1 Tax=Paraglaciecola chathamensis TaxID=368405 RepID=UPI0023563265|nr:hypothetical protein [Paraglaciecola agarilytica]